MLTFRHNDAEHAEDILKAARGKYRNVLLITETVFSMDGDRAPLAALTEICAAHDAWLLTDDAHGLGVLAPNDARAPLQMGTLSKALGSYGGYLCAPLRAVVDLMTSRARTHVYSTGLPPSATAAAIAALDVMAADPALCARPLAKARAFTQRLGLPEAQSPSSRWSSAARNWPSSLAPLAGRRLSCRRNPAPDRSGRICAAALCFLQPRMMMRMSRGSPMSSHAARSSRCTPDRPRFRPPLFITATGTDIGKSYVDRAYRALCADADGRSSR